MRYFNQPLLISSNGNLFYEPQSSFFIVRLVSSCVCLGNLRSNHFALGPVVVGLLSRFVHLTRTDKRCFNKSLNVYEYKFGERKNVIAEKIHSCGNSLKTLLRLIGWSPHVCNRISSPLVLSREC